MSQCNALLYTRGDKLGYYCVLDDGHRGNHETDGGTRFTEAQATRIQEPKADKDTTRIACLKKK
jgi:hypothetical protein